MDCMSLFQLDHFLLREIASTMLVFTSSAWIAILLDLITGIAAARHEGHKLSSIKWGVTINKMLAQLLYMMFAILLYVFVLQATWFRVLLILPVILYILREYISIGENMARRYDGKMPYIFKLLDRVFDLLEVGFFRMIEKRLNASVNTMDNLNQSEESKVVKRIRDHYKSEVEQSTFKETDEDPEEEDNLEEP